MNMNAFTNGLQVRVAAKTLEAIDICSFELVAVDGQGLPAFSAGSHVDVQVSEGVTRQYSLCNDPAESHRYVIAVLKDPNTRGGSKAMHERVQPGDVLTISPPKNHFPLAHGADQAIGTDHRQARHVRRQRQRQRLHQQSLAGPPERIRRKPERAGRRHLCGH
jgi:hypothetical protein